MKIRCLIISGVSLLCNACSTMSSGPEAFVVQESHRMISELQSQLNVANVPRPSSQSAPHSLPQKAPVRVQQDNPVIELSLFKNELAYLEPQADHKVY